MKKLQSVGLVFCGRRCWRFCPARMRHGLRMSPLTMTGTVTDPSGAAIAGANVTAKSVERGVTYRP